MTVYQPGDFFVARTDGPKPTRKRLETWTEWQSRLWSWRRAHFIAGTIRWATRSRVNHAGIITTTDGATLEMTFSGCVPGRARGYIVTPMHRDGSPLTAAERATIVSRQLAIKAAGTDYNVSGLFALYCEQRPALMRIPGLNTWVRNKVKDVRSLFCSQDVDWCCRDIDGGLGLYDDHRDVGDVAPEDLLDLAQQSNWPIRHEGPVDVALLR